MIIDLLNFNDFTNKNTKHAPVCPVGHFQHFSVLHYHNCITCGFRLIIRQNKQFEKIALGSEKSYFFII